MAPSPSELWRVGQRGFPARYPLVQFPNAPLLVALLASFVSRFLDGDPYAVARAVFVIGVAGWAWLEVLHGDNAFRRVLGVAGLVFVVITVAAAELP